MRTRILRMSKYYKRLHPITKEAIDNIDQYDTKQALATKRILSVFNQNPSRKTLEKLVHSVHFRLLNEEPSYLQILSYNQNELAKFWPYERDREIIDMDNIESNSLKVLWTRNNSKALELLNFARHDWLKPKPWTIVDTEKIQELTGTDSIGFAKMEESFKLSPEERESTLRQTFQQYYFLKCHPNICVSKKLPIPIVEIGLKPDGSDITNARIDNLFTSKVKAVLNVVSNQNPPLSEKANSTLLEIVRDSQLNRPLRRLYQTVCTKAYVLKDGKFEISQLARAGFYSHIPESEKHTDIDLAE